MLTVEDGTGLAAADSYVSRADADAYWVDRPHTTAAAAWVAAADDHKDGALREAAAFIDAQYQTQFRGRRATAGQALAWPRSTGEVDDDGAPVPLLDGDEHEIDGIPPAVVTATIAAAGTALSGALARAVDQAGVKEFQVGDVKTVFADGASSLSGVHQATRQLLASLMESERDAPSWKWR